MSGVDWERVRNETVNQEIDGFASGLRRPEMYVYG